MKRYDLVKIISFKKTCTLCSHLLKWLLYVKSWPFYISRSACQCAGWLETLNSLAELDSTGRLDLWALHSAWVELQQNGDLFLNEDFMNAIFDNIYEDSEGNPAPLPPLQEAMKYQYEEKQTVAIDGLKIRSTEC
jgi:hypothetical protein